MYRSLEELIEAIKVQNGTSNDPIIDWDNEFNGERWENWRKKVVWEPGADFGSAVEVESEDFPTERGYLTTIPPYHECDCDGVIHLPSTFGEKCDAGPVWMTILDCANLPEITRITIKKRVY